MNQIEREAVIKNNADAVWALIHSLNVNPMYPAIVQAVLISAHEEEYYDHDLEYEEKYTETLELREGLIVAHVKGKSSLLGIGDAVILDFKKHALLRIPRVTRCGLILPMISAQGAIVQPQDYLNYYEAILSQIDAYQRSSIKKSLRC